MRNLKKKLAALVLGLATMASSVMSMSASALTYDDWVDGEYKPLTGRFYADNSQVSVANLTWYGPDFGTTLTKYPDDEYWWHSIEFEFRPQLNTNGVETKNDIWGETTTVSSTFPYAYRIFENQSTDPDDVSVGCKRISALNAGQAYSARMYMNTDPGAPTTHNYTFEVELGIMPANGNDSLPLRCVRYGDSVNNVSFGNVYTWQP